MSRHDYSLPERTLALWCPLTLGILALTSLGLRYVTNPIDCWCPAEFHGAAVRYTNDVCFQTTDITPVTSSEDHPSLDAIPQTQPTYHQWVPFSLGMAAILCLLPHFLWRMLSGLLWLDTHALAQTLADNQRQNPATRHVMLKDSALLLQAGLRGGNWTLTAAAMLRKASACLVCVLQLILIITLFDPQLSARVDPPPKDSDQQQSPEEGSRDSNASIALPELFICTVPIRMMSNIRHFSHQCFMPLAQVYSKGFTFLFYLFLLLAVCCVLDLLTFLSRLAIPGLRDLSLHRYLAVSQPPMDPQMSAVLQRFLHSLGMDGRLVLAVTADLCGPVAAADLSNHLWMTFKASPRPGPLLSADPAQGHQASGVTTVPTVPAPAPAGGGAGGATVPSSSADAIPLIPVGDGGMKEAKA